jgi:tRNA pseudouridine38-40 synthase
VQEKLNAALQTFLRKDIETTGAGRTDTGVHARQLFVHFDSNHPLLEKDAPKCMHALNSLLPKDIAIHRIIQVGPNAHARFDATERSYEYHIHFQKNPFLVNRSCLMRDRPDLAKMNEAAQYLLGTQDFGCFSKSNTQVFTNICTVKDARWEATATGMVFYITADRFLRNMVRAIVGTLLEIGVKGQPISSIEATIASKDRTKAGISVPAEGLYLTRVAYPYIQP